MDIKNRLTLLITVAIMISIFAFTGCSQGQRLDEGPVGQDIPANVDQSPEIGDIEDNDEAQEQDAQEEQEQQGYNNDFTLLDLEGNEVSLSDFEGQIVVLNFWATWCNPCKMEIPDFIEVNNMFKDEGVQFLGVSSDNVDNLKSFVDEYGIDYPTLIDGSIDSISKYWRISAIPTTYIVDGSGNAVFRQIGLMTKNQLVNAIEEQL